MEVFDWTEQGYLEDRWMFACQVEFDQVEEFEVLKVVCHAKSRHCIISFIIDIEENRELSYERTEITGALKRIPEDG